MLVDVASGHAASGQGWLVNVAAQWLHVTAVGVWLGGLLALLVSLRGEASDARARAVRRFSTVAGFALLVVALTGVIRAIAEIGTVDALLSTDFGRIVIAKTLLLVVLAGFGAFNRFVSVPRAVATLRWLRRVGTTEVATAALVVALTAVLVDLAPPISVGPGQAAAVAPIVTTGNDFGTSVRLRLVATPGAAGVNEFSVVATDAYFTAPPTRVTPPPSARQYSESIASKC